MSQDHDKTESERCYMWKCGEVGRVYFGDENEKNCCSMKEVKPRSSKPMSAAWLPQYR